MRRLLVAAICAALFVASSGPAQAAGKSEGAALPAGSIGLGLQLGCPTGITVRLRLSPSNSFQAAGGFGCGEDLIVEGDYLYEMGAVASDPSIHIGWYLGVGGRYAYWDGYWDNRLHHGDVDLGPQVPIGLRFTFPTSQTPLPIELYVEVAPGIDFVDNPGFRVDGGVGGRFFF